MTLREQNIEKRRQRILAAARQIIASDGPDGLNVRALGRRARVSVTTLYNLFGTKDDILMALIEDGIAAIRPLLENERAADPAAALQRLMTRPVSYLVANAAVFRPLIAVGMQRNENRTPPMQLLYSRIIAGMEPLVEAAQQSGYLADWISPRLVAAELFFSFRVAVEDWGTGVISDGALARRVQTGITFVLLAASTEKLRTLLQDSLRHAQKPALNDLGDLFPGLGAAAVRRKAAKHA